ncbi:MAG TPA: Arc family DNA-binding protein [Gaiellaceae bacterium]|nr:Arc family DNA-binding protein [Gaiellaceae bacterium]
MPNVHVRDVPPEALEVLKEAAKRHCRSLNSEIVDLLVTQAERERRSAYLLERLAEGRRRWKRWFPDGYPPGLEPEAVIRRDRDFR